MFGASNTSVSTMALFYEVLTCCCSSCPDSFHSVSRDPQRTCCAGSRSGGDSIVLSWKGNA